MNNRMTLLELSKVKPPIQPCLIANMKSYQQMLLRWNNLYIKSNALFFEFTTGATGDLDVPLFPDDCFKVIFECNINHPKAFVYGLTTERTIIMLKPETTYFVFMPYFFMGSNNLMVKPSELIDKKVDFADVFPNSEIIGQIALEKNFKNRIDLFITYANSNLINQRYSPGLIEYSAIMMCLSKGTDCISNLEKYTGYSERYCREEFKKAYGLSPKRYSRILRFQSVLYMLYKGDNMLDAVYGNHFFDQAHFIKEFKQFTSSTPARFINSYILEKDKKLILLTNSKPV